MNLNKLTIKSQEALADAQNIASQYGNQEITDEHILYALVKQDEGTVKAIIKKSAAAGQEELVLTGILKDLLTEIEKKPKVS
jgi:ATP-dependent Clp protease ATP-binding subunit ClpB